MEILLTGATGFLGNNILRLLQKSGHTIYVTVRNTTPLESLEGLELVKIATSLDSNDLTRLLPERLDAVIHCAAQIQIGHTQLQESRTVNVEGTRRLAEYARHASARFVHISTVDTLAFSPDGRPQTETDRVPAKPPATYVVTKREAEEVLASQIALGLEAVILHPGFMLGPWDWRPSSAEMLTSVVRFRPPFAPAGGASVADVRDVAQGVINALELGRPGENYILGGENVSYLDLWQRMAHVAGCRKPRIKLPTWLARASGRFGDLKARWTGNETTLNSIGTQMGQLLHFYSSEKAQLELKYSFRPADEAIQASYEWCVQRNWIPRRA